MPYLPKDVQELLDKTHEPTTPGELNYVLTCMIRDYLKRHVTNYSALNEVDGVIGLVQHEFRRRILDPYENSKLFTNGDVWKEMA